MTDKTEQKVTVEGNSRDVNQETTSNKIENRDVDQVVINQTDPLTFITLVIAFILWSIFLYKLPSPDQIWKK